MRGAMTLEQLEILIGFIEHISCKPSLYRLQTIPVGQELTFFNGFAASLRFALGFGGGSLRERELRHHAAQARGWAIDRHPHQQMIERGLSSDNVLSELALLEVEFMRLAAEELFSAG
jgi:hypothetical protein